MLRMTIGLLLLGTMGCKLSGGPTHFANPAKAPVPAASQGVIPAVVTAQASPLFAPAPAPMPSLTPVPTQTTMPNAGIVVAAPPASSPSPVPVPWTPPVILPTPPTTPPMMMLPPSQSMAPRPANPIYTPVPTDGMNIASGLTTQDVMLIPRMVYVPYAPQTPMNPARLSSLVPPGHPAAMPMPNPQADAATERMANALERSTQMMEKMTLRIAVLEEMVRQQPLRPTPPPAPTPGDGWARPMPLPTPQPALNPPIAMPKILPPTPAPMNPLPTPLPAPKFLPPTPEAKPPESPAALEMPKPEMAVEMPPLPMATLPIPVSVSDANWTPASATVPAPMPSPTPALRPSDMATQLMPPPNLVGYDSPIEIEPIRVEMPASDLAAGSKLPKFPGHYLRPFYPYAK